MEYIIPCTALPFICLFRVNTKHPFEAFVFFDTLPKKMKFIKYKISSKDINLTPKDQFYQTFKSLRFKFEKNSIFILYFIKLFTKTSI